MSSSSSSTISASVTSSAAAATSSAAATLSAGSNLKVVGIILAVASGVLIGSSFVFKKKGLLRSQANGVAGEGVAYLKSPLWWTGMIMMILGELCNFAAYAFVEALVVTPLGALSVVICAILSSIFLKETLTFFGWLGCGLCILGSVIIALNGPSESSVGQIRDFQKLFLAPGFLAYGSVLIAASLVIAIYFAPRYGKKSMLWYIMVCSMIGGISVSVTTGLGAAIVTTAYGDNQFKYWFMYFLLVFVVATLLTEVYYLNVALALFNTAMVTPTYYVIFTFFSIITTIVLFQGLKASAKEIITLVMGFLVICFGIVILQMSKVDPREFSKLDRRSTILLQAARSRTENWDRGEHGDGEKSVLGAEDPGMDALRGSFGAFGSIIRARSARRMSQSSSNFRGSRLTGLHHNASLYDPHGLMDSLPALDGLKRHQLYDAPVPPRSPLAAGHSLHPPQTPTTAGGDVNSTSSLAGTPVMGKKPTIKFGDEDVVRQYDRPGTGDRTTEHRRAVVSPLHGLSSGGNAAGVGAGGGYPPLPLQSQQTPGARMDGLPSGGGGWGGLTLETGSGSDVPNVTIEGPTRSTGAGSGSGSGSNSSGSTTRPQGNPSFSLLSDSPVSLRTNSKDSQQGNQILEIPHGWFRNDKEVRSAPPTVSPTTGPAPANNPFARTAPGRLQARNIFSPSGSGPGGSFIAGEGGNGAGTDSALLSFPSVTDSARSDIMWDEDDILASSSNVGGGRPGAGAGVPHGSSPLNPASGHGRTGSMPESRSRTQSQSNDSSLRGAKGAKKHYPKGAGDDDTEESKSLWRRSQESMEEVGGGEESPLSPSLDGGGIRLVTPPPRVSSANRF